MEAREVCSSPEELEERRAFWASQPGRVVLRADSPECGEFGYTSFLERPDGVEKWTREDEKAVLTLYRPFGALDPLHRVARDAGAFVDSFLIHQCHKDKFFRISNAAERTRGFVCYCEASSGVSHVVMIPLTRLKGIVESFSEDAKRVQELVRNDDENILDRILKSHRG
jgi:hypothetical protein